MATDFFQRQDQARGQTLRLVVAFCIAVTCVVSATSAVAFAIVLYLQKNTDNELGTDALWVIPAIVAVATAGMISLGSLYKIVALRFGGGASVAEHLGGTRLYPGTEDPADRQLLNVVEEMAIAAGVPVPPVFLLRDEPGINAFAAGYSAADAVIGVTRGATHSLTREQMQGVIAHEFSHILNGDMRLGIRLIGVLHGILLLGLTGRTILELIGRSSHHHHRRSRSDKDSGSGQFMVVLLVAAIALMIIGAVGGFVGNLIKAAVSRSRERLADASAVQFTRNPDGLAGALKRIGAAQAGSSLVSPNAAEASHLYFAKGLAKGFASFFATHPPLEERIRWVDPSWDGRFPDPASFGMATPKFDHYSRPQSPTDRVNQLRPSVTAQDAAEKFAGPQPAYFAADTMDGVTTSDLLNQHASTALDHHRTLGAESQRYARTLRDSLPEILQNAARDPFAARAIVFSLLLSRDGKIREIQTTAIRDCLDSAIIPWIKKLAPHCHNLDDRQRLPLVDLLAPALDAMSKSQYQSFDKAFWRVVRADDKIELFEWTLAQVLNRQLKARFLRVESPVTKYYGLQRLTSPVSLLLSKLSQVGHDEAQAKHAFAIAAKRLPEIQLQWFPPHECSFENLETGLKLIRSASLKQRQRVIQACIDVIAADGRVATREAELFRGIGDLIDYPIPPLQPEQRL